MTVDYNTLNPESRLWIYTSPRPFSEAEKQKIQTALDDFTSQWQAHGKDVYSHGAVIEDHFIFLFADENRSGVTGCSIDASVRLFRELSLMLEVDLFDRMRFYSAEGDKPACYDRRAFENALEHGEVTGETMIFDTTVPTKAAFEKSWKKPLSQSAFSRLFTLA
jgi:hypothetical protein